MQSIDPELYVLYLEIGYNIIYAHLSNRNGDVQRKDGIQFVNFCSMVCLNVPCCDICNDFRIKRCSVRLYL